MIWSLSVAWKRRLRSRCRAGCCRRSSLRRVRYGARRATLGLGGGPVARPELELLGVEVLLAARPHGDVLVQLEAGVDAPGRRQGRRQRGPDPERRRAAVLQVRVQDVGGVDEEVGPQEVRGLLRQLGEVLLELPLLVAPGEVRVALVEADPGQRLHHRRPGERLGEEQHVRVGLAHLGQQPLPERDRLGVRVVDPEHPHAEVHPLPDDPQHLGVDAVGVAVEVDRVDVLVLLGRVLGVRDRAVGELGEPLGVRGHPRVVRGGLQRQVERDLHAEVGRLLHEGGEVLLGAEVRVDGVVTAVGRADRPRRADVVRAGGQRVVGALAVRRPDRVDRRQVDDVEAHRGHRGQPLGGGLEGAGAQDAVRVLRGALGAGEELVPAAEQRALAVDPERHPVARGDVVAQRLLAQGGEHVGRVGRGEPGRHRPGGVAQRGRGVDQRPPTGRRARRGRPLEHPGALLEHQLDVDPGLDLDARVVVPGGDRVAPRLDREGPATLAGGRDLGRPPVGAGSARASWG